MIPITNDVAVAFAFGALAGIGVMTAVYKKQFKRTEYKCQKMAEMGIYVAHLLEKYEVPLNEFDAIVISTIALEVKNG